VYLALTILLSRHFILVRALILIHRYLGIAIGLVMAMWCASGLVMMYVGYPTLDNEQRLRALEPLDFHNYAFDKVSALLGVDVVDSFEVEMIAGRPILRAKYARGVQAIDLVSGERLSTIKRAQAELVATRFANATSVQKSELIDRDQWTVSGQFNGDRPLHHVVLGDARGTELYVSSTSGAVVQVTTSHERFWNWLGAVPHWLYPTILRQHPAVWSQVVIWLSLAGVFLTSLGLYIGIDHWRAMQGTKLSPYRGVPLWHHLSGLFFGVLALTWVGSGLVSMSPWGLFEGGDFRDERDRVRDLWIDGGQIVDALRRIAAESNFPSATRIESAPFAGKLYLLVYSSSAVQRIDAKTLAAMPLEKSRVEKVAQQFSGGHTAQVDFLATGDSYYYSGHDPRTFPVYRIALDDRERSRYYLDATSGDLIDKIDSSRRAYRWLFEGLHRFDFIPALRQRPWWDLLVLPLMIGVTVVCFTGVYMGYRRVLPKKRFGE
jgi:hypothetical protein